MAGHHHYPPDETNPRIEFEQHFLMNSVKSVKSPKSDEFPKVDHCQWLHRIRRLFRDKDLNIIPAAIAITPLVP